MIVKKNRGVGYRSGSITLMDTFSACVSILIPMVCYTWSSFKHLVPDKSEIISETTQGLTVYQAQ